MFESSSCQSITTAVASADSSCCSDMRGENREERDRNVHISNTLQLCNTDIIIVNHAWVDFQYDRHSFCQLNSEFQTPRPFTPAELSASRWGGGNNAIVLKC